MDGSANDGGGSDGSDGGGSDGGGSVSYLGCTFVGGLDRVVVAKRDSARGLCFNVVMVAPGQAPDGGLTLPAGFGLERAGVGPIASCPSRSAQTVAATSTTGSITAPSRDGGFAEPAQVTVDVTLTFGANDAGAPLTEQLSAQDVDVTANCQ